MPKRARRIHVTVKDGLFLFGGMGHWLTYWRDPYHLFLVMPWWLFLLAVVVVYVLINLVFASLYVLGGDGIANAQPGSFRDALPALLPGFCLVGWR